MKGSGSVIPLATQDEIVRLYVHEAMSMRRIAVRVHWSEGAIYNVLSARGIQRRPPGGAFNVLPQEQFDRITELYQAGRSQRAISQELGIPASTVRYRLGRTGIALRDRAEVHDLVYRRCVADRGPAALSQNQRRALEVLEANREHLRTDQIARRMQASDGAAYAALKRLRVLGLAASKREVGARIRRCTWKRTRLPISDIVDAALNPVARRGRGDLMLPIEPFREWISGLVAQERRAAMHLAVSNDGRGHVGPGDVSIEGRVAQRLGFAERRMWAVLNESAHVSLTVADRALQNAGTGIRLWDLWPELGEEEAS